MSFVKHPKTRLLETRFENLPGISSVQILSLSFICLTSQIGGRLRLMEPKQLQGTCDDILFLFSSYQGGIFNASFFLSSFYALFHWVFSLVTVSARRVYGM